MKILARENDTCTFEFTADELQLLFHVLKLYPCTSQSFQEVSKFEDDEKVRESQEMLDEALEEQKTANKKIIRDFIGDTKRFPRSGEEHRVTLTETEIDWLLQVLNDIRVGLWVKLGSPDQEKGLPTLQPEAVRDYSIMQLAGELEGFLLYALNSEP